MIVETFHSSAPKSDALRFSACLAVDRGVPSDLTRVSGGWHVVADDGQIVAFLKA